MLRNLLFGFLWMNSVALLAQTGSFTATVAAEVPPGEPFALTVTLQDVSAEGELVLPDFSPLQLVGGPQTSSSMTMINGRVNRSTTYTYYLQAPEEGTFVLLPFEVMTADGPLRTRSQKVTVRAGAPAPRSAPRRARPELPGFEDFFGTPRPAPAPRGRSTTRRKTYRI